MLNVARRVNRLCGTAVRHNPAFGIVAFMPHAA